jgi:RHS repeat-associated protein
MRLRQPAPYQQRGRLRHLVTTTSANDSNATVQDVRYGFRADGSIRSIENTPQIDDSGSAQITVRTEYRYDGLARLSRARGEYTREYNGEQRSENWVNAWAWAPNGNLLRRDTLDYAGNSLTSRESYSYAGHAQTAVDNSSAGRTQTLRYDDAGNLCQQTDNVSGESKTMEHDYANRISAVRNAAGDVVGRYWYDDQGFRVRRISRQKQENGDKKEVELLYPSMYFGIERSLDADGKPDEASGYAVNNIYVNGVRVAAMLPDAQAVYYLTDQVDSVKVITDDRGLPITAMEYKPFGETWLTSGKTNHAPKYNSQELDRETGFYFYNARHYDPALAHFVTADTVIDGEFTTQGWNRYMYCKGNPVLYKDPSGHFLGLAIPALAAGISVGSKIGLGYVISNYIIGKKSEGVQAGGGSVSAAPAAGSTQTAVPVSELINPNSITSEQLEQVVMSKNGDKKVDFSSGSHIVMLRDFYRRTPAFQMSKEKRMVDTCRWAVAPISFWIICLLLRMEISFQHMAGDRQRHAHHWLKRIMAVTAVMIWLQENTSLGIRIWQINMDTICIFIKAKKEWMRIIQV